MAPFGLTAGKLNPATVESPVRVVFDADDMHRQREIGDVRQDDHELRKPHPFGFCQSAFPARPAWPACPARPRSAPARAPNVLSVRSVSDESRAGMAACTHSTTRLIASPDSIAKTRCGKRRPGARRSR